MDDFASDIVDAMCKYPISHSQAYDEEVTNIAGQYNAKRDPDTRDWVLPDGSIIGIKDLADLFKLKNSQKSQAA